MSTKSEIRKNLKILGILSKNQISEKTNLDYWWQKKYREIQLSNKTNRQAQLIRVNQAKDLLDKYELNFLKNIFKDTSNFENEKENLKTNGNKKITYNYSENLNKNRILDKKSISNSRNSDPSPSWWQVGLAIYAGKLIYEFIKNNS